MRAAPRPQDAAATAKALELAAEGSVRVIDRVGELVQMQAAIGDGELGRLILAENARALHASALRGQGARPTSSCP